MFRKEITQHNPLPTLHQYKFMCYSFFCNVYENMEKLATFEISHFILKTFITRSRETHFIKIAWSRYEMYVLVTFQKLYATTLACQILKLHNVSR